MREGKKKKKKRASLSPRFFGPRRADLRKEGGEEGKKKKDNKTPANAVGHLRFVGLGEKGEGEKGKQKKIRPSMFRYFSRSPPCAAGRRREKKEGKKIRYPELCLVGLARGSSGEAAWHKCRQK